MNLLEATGLDLALLVAPGLNLILLGFDLALGLDLAILEAPELDSALLLGSI